MRLKSDLLNLEVIWSGRDPLLPPRDSIPLSFENARRGRGRTYPILESDPSINFEDLPISDPQDTEEEVEDLED